MRIAYCTQTYPPMVSGAAIVAQGLAEGMAQCWHEVLVLTSSDQGQAYTLSKPNLTIRRFRSYVNPLRVGQRLTLWPHNEFITALRAFQPDIIHTHDPFQFGWSALAYARQTRTPIILTTHQVPDFILKYLPDQPALKRATANMLWAYARALLSQFECVIAPSQTSADAIKANTNITPQVAGFGINSKYFHSSILSKHKEATWRAKLGINLSAPILLHVGRLDRDKQVEFVLRAAAQAMRNNSSELLIVGDGTEKNRLHELAEELRISARCHFPGFIRWKDGLADIYRMARLFVTASEIETQGLVLLEAAASGLPIVAFNATCIHEIVKQGVNGYLAAPGDVTGLAACILKLIAEPNLARRFGDAGQLIGQDYRLEKTLTTHEAIYMQTIAKKADARISQATTWRGRAGHSGASG